MKITILGTKGEVDNTKTIKKAVLYIYRTKSLNCYLNQSKKRIYV